MNSHVIMMIKKGKVMQETIQLELVETAHLAIRNITDKDGETVQFMLMVRYPTDRDFFDLFAIPEDNIDQFVDIFRNYNVELITF